MQLFESKNNSLIGLDIGVSAVKLIELKGSYSDPSLVGWAVQPIESGAVSENAVADVDKVIDAVASAVSKARCRAKNAAVAVSSSHAITKIISMPADLSDREMEEQVEIEAMHYIPYPMEDVNLDFEVLGASEDNHKNEVDVLLAACRREIVEDYVSVVEGAGLTAIIVDIDTYALERAFRFASEEDGVVALLDIGALTTDLGVFDTERVLYTRHQSFGAKQLIDKVRRHFSIGENEAQALIASQNPPAEYLQEVLPSFIEVASQEATRALQFFYSSSTHSTVDSVLLTGGCSATPGFAEALSSSLKVPVRLFNPVARFKPRSSSARQALEGASGVLGVASGLALRGVA